MSCRYSTNWMGPASMDWYRKRGLTKLVTYTVESELIANLKKLNIGDTYEVEEITEHWSGGRIDIRGDTLSEYGDELALPVMHVEDYVHFSEWLETVETDCIWDLTNLVMMYEKTNPKIRWAEDIFKDERKT